MHFKCFHFSWKHFLHGTVSEASGILFSQIPFSKLDRPLPGSLQPTSADVYLFSFISRQPCLVLTSLPFPPACLGLLPGVLLLFLVANWKRKQIAQAPFAAQQAGVNSPHSPCSWVQSALHILWGWWALPRCWFEGACIWAWWTINHADLFLLPLPFWLSWH